MLKYHKILNNRYLQISLYFRLFPSKDVFVEKKGCFHRSFVLFFCYARRGSIQLPLSAIHCLIPPKFRAGHSDSLVPTACCSVQDGRRHGWPCRFAKSRPPLRQARGVKRHGVKIERQSVQIKPGDPEDPCMTAGEALYLQAKRTADLEAYYLTNNTQAL